MLPLQPGDPAEVGRYRLLGRLGSGATGVVFLGEPTGDGTVETTRVAVKVLRPELADDPDLRTRLAREAGALTVVASPYVVRVLDADVATQRPYVVMEYAQGTSLHEALAPGAPLPEPNAYRLAADLAQALAAVHATGLVHRDLKPSNVILGPDRARLVDFGIASALEGSSLTRTGWFVGTQAWAAPEQIMGAPATPAVDVFAWGLLVAWATTGRHPYGEGRSDLVMYRIVHDRPDLGGVPESLRPAVEAALDADPARRPTAAALAAALGGPPPLEAPLAAPPAAQPPAPGATILPTAGAVAAATAAAGTTAAAGIAAADATAVSGPAVSGPAVPGPAVGSQTAVTAHPVGMPGPAPARRRRWPLWLGLGALALVVLVLAAVVLTDRPTDVTAEVAPTTIEVGDSVTVTGRVGPGSGRTVVVESSDDGEDWKVASDPVTTDTDGGYSVEIRLTAAGRVLLRAAAEGSLLASAGVSPEVSVTVTRPETRVEQTDPFDADGSPRPEFTVSGPEPGACAASSLAGGAYSCLVLDSSPAVDPCYAPPVGEGPLLCISDPRGGPAVQASTPLLGQPSERTTAGAPWYLLLDGDVGCLLSGDRFERDDVRYTCSDGRIGLGAPDRTEEPWTLRVGAADDAGPDPGSLADEVVLTAWF